MRDWGGLRRLGKEGADGTTTWVKPQEQMAGDSERRCWKVKKGTGNVVESPTQG